MRDHTSGTAHVLVDVTGWFSPDSGGRYVTLPEPTRVVDTTTGIGLRNTPLSEGEMARFQISGVASVSWDATPACPPSYPCAPPRSVGLR